MSSRRPLVKICCIRNTNEADLALSLGASALGFVSQMPSGPGVISESLIASIVALVPPPIATFLLTCSQSPDQIMRQQQLTKVTTIQLVDRLGSAGLRELRRALPGIALVQVIHASGPESLAEAIAIAPEVDAILLDSGNPSLAVKELGGTGRTHDWAISRRICQSVDVPVWLAGGLKPDNVADAISAVGPFGIDVCSGLRTEGGLDRSKLTAFFEAVNTPRQ